MIIHLENFLINFRLVEQQILIEFNFFSNKVKFNQLIFIFLAYLKNKFIF
jgi:hypothetical protein